MKRVLKFQICDNEYVFLENNEDVFKINKLDLQFNVKNFYQAFFAEGQDYSDIELQNLVSSDKEATRIFECVEQLINQIVEKLNSELSDAVEEVKTDNITDK